MKRIMLAALTLGLGFGIQTTAMADQVATNAPSTSAAVVAPAVHTPKINAREREQQQRILQGIHSDELTRHETVSLEKGEGKILADKRLAKADGNVTPAERAKLDHQLNHESKVIYKLKHNDRVRG